MSLLTTAWQLICEDLASRVLHSRLSEAAKRDQELRTELATCHAKIADLETKLENTDKQLAIVNGEVNPAKSLHSSDSQSC